MIFYCTQDGAGPFAAINWTVRAASVGQARADAERAACKSHVVRIGCPPHTATGDASQVAQALVAGQVELVGDGEADEHGGVLARVRVAESDLGEALLCPECNAPLRMVASAPMWEPPADLVVEEPPAPPSPEPVYRTSGQLVTQPRQLDSALRVLGVLSTSPAGLLNRKDTVGSVGALIGSIDVAGGSIGLRLTEINLATGESRALIDSAIGPGSRFLSIGTTQPWPGPCRYVLEGQLLEATEATLWDASLALYEVLP